MEEGCGLSRNRKTHAEKFSKTAKPPKTLFFVMLKKDKLRKTPQPRKHGIQKTNLKDGQTFKTENLNAPLGKRLSSTCSRSARPENRYIVVFVQLTSKKNWQYRLRVLIIDY